MGTVGQWALLNVTQLMNDMRQREKVRLLSKVNNKSKSDLEKNKMKPLWSPDCT